ncbi:hypothetical protein B5M47_01935 [candidate division CPR3 bacterium 4484_211]|uniref:RNase H type-1 domain-containing protein n=1 Tax=candidate division CPR3 bacterium 4484_211 TaxID=1968527 RepID=A0A1W9NYM0_UNCC3|nr:MAG: hypothetical protein B5M47_01935 [candidate division CPR3 bacterium 4484_211]
MKDKETKQKKLTIFCDGGARGNPGPGAIGIAIYHQGNLVKSISKFIGRLVTNNQAEYQAIIESLNQAEKLRATHIHLKIDSQLAQRQLTGQYKVKNAGIKVLWEKANRLINNFQEVTLEHIPREKNKEADKLVNEALCHLEKGSR